MLHLWLVPITKASFIFWALRGRVALFFPSLAPSLSRSVKGVKIFAMTSLSSRQDYSSQPFDNPYNQFVCMIWECFSTYLNICRTLRFFFSYQLMYILSSHCLNSRNPYVLGAWMICWWHFNFNLNEESIEGTWLVVI